MGRGMSVEKLTSIREKLSQRHFEHRQLQWSKAVYRDCQCPWAFCALFGDRYAITVDSAEQAGVRYRITIQDE